MLMKRNGVIENERENCPVSSDEKHSPNADPPNASAAGLYSLLQARRHLAAARHRMRKGFHPWRRPCRLAQVLY